MYRKISECLVVAQCRTRCWQGAWPVSTHVPGVVCRMSGAGDSKSGKAPEQIITYWRTTWEMCTQSGSPAPHDGFCCTSQKWFHTSYTAEKKENPLPRNFQFTARETFYLHAAFSLGEFSTYSSFNGLNARGLSVGCGIFIFFSWKPST